MRVCEADGLEGPGVEAAMPRSRAHLLVTHVPVGPFSITHHFPHHDPKAPDITGCRMFSMFDDLRGCPAKHGGLRGRVEGTNSDNHSNGHMYRATTLCCDVSQRSHIKRLS